MKSEEMSMWKLPEEIQVDIFLKLPVNSILACRCVCKSWCNLLCNPKFIKNHLNLSIQSKNNPRLMFGYSQYDKNKNPIINSIDYKSISSPSSSKLKAVSLDYPFENEKIEGIVILGSCNGLICLGISGGGMGIEAKNWVCIWNPATGEYKTIKLQFSDDVAASGSRVSSTYGFGYDSNINDYKLVKMSFNESLVGCPRFHIIQVYTLGTKRWKTIQRTNCYMFPSHLKQKRLPGLLINGALHWSGATTSNQGTNSEVIVCFNINRERLTDVPFPEETKPRLRNLNSDRQVGMLGDCLCVVFLYANIQADIWVMKNYGVNESWTKVFTTTQLTMTMVPCLKPIWCFENGDILIHASGQLSLCGQNNETSMVQLGDIYNMSKSRFTESYVESLVCLKSKKRTTNGNQKEPKRQRLR